MCQFYMLLSYSEERVEVAVLPHKLVEAAALVHTAVLKHQNAVIAAQQRLLQRVRYDDARVMPARPRMSLET